MLKAERKFGLVLLALVLVFVLSACGTQTQTNTAQQSPNNGKPILIGTLFPRSGSIALLGQQAWQGLEIARQMINQDGGIKGRPVQFVDADAPDSQAAATEAERLISQKGVKIIVGSLTSGNALAASAVAERNSVVYWETTAITDDLTSKGYKYVFRMVDTGSVRGRVAMRVFAQTIASKVGKTSSNLRVAVVNEDSAYGQSQAKGALDEAAKLGLNVVVHESYSASATDLSSLVLKIKNANPDVIFAVGYVNDASLFWNQARQYGLKVASLIGGGSGYTDPQFAKVQGKYSDGVMGVDSPTGIPAEKFKNDATKQVATRFRDMYVKQYGGTSVPLAAEVAFTGVWTLLHDVLPVAGSDDPDAVVKAAKSIDIPETIMGYGVKFDNNNQNSKAAAAVYQWKDAKMSLVSPPDYAQSSMENIPLPN